MRIKTILPFAVTLAISIWPSAYAAEGPKPAGAKVENSAEGKARTDYEAAETAATAAEAAVAPAKAAMQKADTAYADARKAANAKRQQATDAKNFAGEPGAAELKQAEANVPAAAKALTDKVEAVKKAIAAKFGQPAADAASAGGRKRMAASSKYSRPSR